MEGFGLPVKVSGLIWQQVYETTKNDKKMDLGTVKFVLLRCIGDSYVDRTVSEAEMKAGYDFISEKEDLS